MKEQAIFFRDKERMYWSARITANSSSARKLWRDMDTVMRRIEETETPTACDAQQAEFLRFFEDKVQKIRKDTSTSPEPTFEQRSGDTNSVRSR